MFLPVTQNFLNIDPDLNFYNDNTYSTTTLYNFDQYNVLCEENNFLTVLTFNIRSFNRNQDDFLPLFSNSSLPDILVLTETWFQPNNSLDIPGFSSYHTYRNVGRSGGVSVFISENFVSHQVPELSFSNFDIEICTVNLRINNTNISVFGIYRPHSGTTDSFISEMSNILQSNKVLNNYSIILGDFNIDMLCANSQSDDLLNFMHSFSFLPTISLPTRANALLDQIWINRLVSFSSGVIDDHITDHLPIFVRLPFQLNKTYTDDKVKISFRCVNDPINRQKYFSTLRDFNWDVVRSGDPHLFLQNFINSLNNIFCQSFHLKTKLVARKRFDNPWFDEECKRLVQLKSNYFHLYKIGAVSLLENNCFKNKVRLLIRKKKSLYFNR